MKKTYIALALLITGFLLAGDAYGDDEVYYCAEIGSNGFFYNEKSGSYEHKAFIEEKFKLNRTLNTLEIAPVKGDKQLFKCHDSLIAEPELLFCSNFFNHFHFNTNTGRFVSFAGYGFVGGDHDGIAVKYGKCDKF